MRRCDRVVHRACNGDVRRSADQRCEHIRLNTPLPAEMRIASDFAAIDVAPGSVVFVIGAPFEIAGRVPGAFASGAVPVTEDAFGVDDHHPSAIFVRAPYRRLADAVRRTQAASADMDRIAPAAWHWLHDHHAADCAAGRAALLPQVDAEPGATRR